MANKHLDGTGKGVYTYDYANDILMFKVKDRDYKKSLEFENMVVDIDTEDFITGVRIFDASKILGIPKVALRKIRNFRFDASIENNVVAVRLNFIAIRRNKQEDQEIRQGQDFVREATGSNIKDSEVVCTVA